MSRSASGATSLIVSASALPASPTSYSYCFRYMNSAAISTTPAKVPVHLFSSGGRDDGFNWNHVNSPFQHAFQQLLSSNAYVASQTTATLTNTWYHLGCVWTGANLGAYTNGVLGSNTACATIKAGTPLLNLLAYGASNATDTTGTIAEFAYWHNVILTATEMLALSSGASPWTVHPDGLTLYWPLFGDSPEPDYSGNRISGTVTSTIVSPHPPVSPGLWLPKRGFQPMPV